MTSAFCRSPQLPSLQPSSSQSVPTSPPFPLEGWPTKRGGHSVLWCPLGLVTFHPALACPEPYLPAISLPCLGFWNVATPKLSGQVPRAVPFPRRREETENRTVLPKATGPGAGKLGLELDSALLLKSLSLTGVRQAHLLPFCPSRAPSAARIKMTPQLPWQPQVTTGSAPASGVEQK